MCRGCMIHVASDSLLPFPRVRAATVPSLSPWVVRGAATHHKTLPPILCPFAAAPRHATLHIQMRICGEQASLSPPLKRHGLNGGPARGCLLAKREHPCNLPEYPAGPQTGLPTAPLADPRGTCASYTRRRASASSSSEMIWKQTACEHKSWNRHA